MLKSLLRLAAAMLFFTIAGEASAHPHVWVTMKSELVYAPDGSVTGVRHAWAFDDMFSTYATQGLESKKKGAFTREELSPLAQTNVESLKEYDYFTIAHANGKKADFKDPVDYWLDYTDGILTLHFTLPFATPVKAKDLQVEMYDPTWFVDFAFAQKDPAQLVGAPATCKLAVQRPGEGQTQTQSKLGEAFFNNLDPSSNFGAQFSNKLTVKCP
jgi:ABC-type uncharacterized transport system substrate-binding protein